VVKKDVEQARTYFSRIGSNLVTHFNRLGSVCVELDATDRLQIFHDFFRIGHETEYAFDFDMDAREFKDRICPSAIVQHYMA
jgi:hypothetical protein